MARPPAKELTQRELEVMHVFWNRGVATMQEVRDQQIIVLRTVRESGEATVQEVRDQLAESGLDRAYTTVATLVRILSDKGFLKQTNDRRPFRFRPARSYEQVSARLLGDLVERVFQGSREQLLLRLVGQKKLSTKERTILEDILKEQSR